MVAASAAEGANATEADAIVEADLSRGKVSKSDKHIPSLLNEKARFVILSLFGGMEPGLHSMEAAGISKHLGTRVVVYCFETEGWCRHLSRSKFAGEGCKLADCRDDDGCEGSALALIEAEGEPIMRILAHHKEAVHFVILSGSPCRRFSEVAAKTVGCMDKRSAVGRQ